MHHSIVDVAQRRTFVSGFLSITDAVLALSQPASNLQDLIRAWSFKGQDGLGGKGPRRHRHSQVMCSQNPTFPHPHRQVEEQEDEGIREHVPGLNALNPTVAALGLDKIHERVFLTSKERKFWSETRREWTSCLPHSEYFFQTQTLQPSRTLCWARPIRGSSILGPGRTERSTSTKATGWLH